MQPCALKNRINLRKASTICESPVISGKLFANLRVDAIASSLTRCTPMEPGDRADKRRKRFTILLYCPGDDALSKCVMAAVYRA